MGPLTEGLTALTELIDALADLAADSPWAYLLVLGLAAFDAVLPILPGESAVLVAAVLAGSGRLDIVTVILAAGVGAFLGDNLAYWIGRTAGRPLILRLLGGRAERLEWVREQSHRRGGSLILVGRFVPGGRTAVALGAGVLHYPWPRYLAYDAAAASLWALQAALPGYIGGVLFADRPWLGLLMGAGLALLLAGTLALVRRVRGGPPAPDRPPPSGAPAAGSDAPGLGARPSAARQQGRGSDHEPDAGPGQERGPQEAELADPQQVTQPRGHGLAGEGPGAGGREHGQDVPARPTPDEQVGAGVERADQQGEDDAGVEEQVAQVVRHRPTDRLRPPRP
jgi:membrane-associated protein